MITYSYTDMKEGVIMYYIACLKIDELPLSVKVKENLRSVGINTIDDLTLVSDRDISSVPSQGSWQHKEIFEIQEQLSKLIDYYDDVENEDEELLELPMLNVSYVNRWKDVDIDDLTLDNESKARLKGAGVEKFSEMLTKTRRDLINLGFNHKDKVMPVLNFKKEYWDSLTPINSSTDTCEEIFITDLVDEVMYGLFHDIELDRVKLEREINELLAKGIYQGTTSTAEIHVIEDKYFCSALAMSPYLLEVMQREIHLHIQFCYDGITKKEILELIPPIYREPSKINAILINLEEKGCIIKRGRLYMNYREYWI